MPTELPGAFAILETAAALAFVFFMLSLICSSLLEAISTTFNLRAKNLQKGISSLLHCSGFRGNVDEQLYEHPLIKSLVMDHSLVPRNPTEIPAKTFAVAILDIVKSKNGGTDVTNSSQVTGLNNPDLERMLKTLIDLSGADATKIREGLELWYDSAMKEVANWYKEMTRRYMFPIGVCLAVVMNVNAITITSALYNQPEVRHRVLKTADTLKDKQDKLAQSELDDLAKEFKELQLPIGWSEDAKKKYKDVSNVVIALGWVLSGLAISFGGPFWFDLFNQLMAVRRGRIKPADGK